MLRVMMCCKVFDLQHVWCWALTPVVLSINSIGARRQLHWCWAATHKKKMEEYVCFCRGNMFDKILMTYWYREYLSLIKVIMSCRCTLMIIGSLFSYSFSGCILTVDSVYVHLFSLLVYLPSKLSYICSSRFPSLCLWDIVCMKDMPWLPKLR